MTIVDIGSEPASAQVTKVEIGIDGITVEFGPGAPLADAMQAVRELWKATRSDAPRTTIGPTGNPYMEKASGPEYGSAHQIDM